MVKQRWNSKFLSSLAASTIAASAIFTGGFVSANISPASAEAAMMESPDIDLNIVNEDRLAKHLKERGLLAKNASPADAHKAVKEYIKQKQGEAFLDRKSTRLNSSHSDLSRMPSSA